MKKDLNISILMDFYGELLTQKQQDSLDFYYNQDYSLFEIAQHMNISRQGVRDFIKRGEKQLIEMEQKLGLANRFLLLSYEFEQMDKIIDVIIEDNTSVALSQELEQLRCIANKIKKNL